MKGSSVYLSAQELEALHDEWVEITLPDGRSIHSVFSDCLTFECRSIQYSSNAWMELWLTDNKVPYAHG